MHNIPLLLTACLLYLATCNAYAKSELTVAPGIMKFDYTERGEDGSFYDGEYGYIPGVELDFRKDQPNGSVLGFSFGYYNGTVDYDGAIQSQNNPNLDGLPFKSDTNEAVTTFMGYFSKPLSNSGTDLQIYGTFAYKIWERDVRGKTISCIGTQGIPFQNESIPDLLETYKWWQFSLGLKYQLDLSPNSGLQINAGVLRTLNPQMEVDISQFYTNINSYTATYNLKAKWGYEAVLAG